MLVVVADVNRKGVPVADLPGGTVLTVGVYDGVHLGHQAVIAQVIALAGELGAASAVVTFDPHPATVVRPDSAPMQLTTLSERLALMESLDIDIVYVVAFDADASRESAEDFVHRVLVGSLQAKAVVVGDDFHFGFRRQGNVALLRTIGVAAGFEVHPIHLIGAVDGLVYSSTEIRKALHDGRIGDAERMLGRPIGQAV